MISNDDFIFCIGYDGDTAIVDGKAKEEFSRLSSAELAEKGLYRAAFASVLYSKNPEEMKAFLDLSNKKSGTQYTESSQLSRLFGVYLDEISKVKVLWTMHTAPYFPGARCLRQFLPLSPFSRNKGCCLSRRCPSLQHLHNPAFQIARLVMADHDGMIEVL
jgi:hypothetical protein